MKSKIKLIAVVALVIAATVCLIIAQRRQMNANPAPELAATVTPTQEAPHDAIPTPDVTAPDEPTSVPDATGDLSTSSSPNPVTGPAFSVYINGKTISIANGVDEQTLDKGPGWLATSAAPGRDGMCVIYGHRNRTHLRILETVEAGDSVTATMPDGTEYVYIITQVQAFEDTADLVIPTLDGKSIALITCYPFRYSGSAPGKYLVVGQLDADVSD